MTLIMNVFGNEISVKLQMQTSGPVSVSYFSAVLRDYGKQIVINSRNATETTTNDADFHNVSHM